MAINLFEYMAYLENRKAEAEAEAAADFEQRMKEYETERAAEIARRQMSLDEMGAELVAQDKRAAQAWEEYKAVEAAKKKTGGR